DAILERTGTNAEPLAEKTTAFFDGAAKCEKRDYPSIGYGSDYRFQGEKFLPAFLTLPSVLGYWLQLEVAPSLLRVGKGALNRSQIFIGPSGGMADTTDLKSVGA